MSTVSLYPLRFDPIFRRYLWGGRRLRTEVFGDGFVEALERNYELAHEIEGQLVYLPRAD